MFSARSSLISASFFALLVLFSAPNSSGQSVFRAVLDGAQEVPSASTQATGSGTVMLNAAETHISYRLEFNNLSSSQTASHIHGASPRGVNSGVLFNIGANGMQSGVFFADNVPISPANVANLKSGLFYFNVHTSSFPGGEIRGQIEPECVGLPTGSVSWWQGEGNPFDQNALNNGTLENGTSFAPGRVGRAFSFDGSDDYVDVPDSASLDTVTAMTIDAWVFPTQLKSQRVITKWGQSGFRTFTIDFSSDARANFFISTDGNNFAAISTPPGDVPINQWTHLAIVFEGGNFQKIYINGVERATAAAPPSMFNSASSFRLGRNFNDDPGTLNYSGRLDEVSLFNRALGQSEIAAIYSAGAAGKCPPCVPTPIGLAEWWTGDGNALGGRNRNNGSLLNGATFTEGMNGHAFSFDGNNDVVLVPDSPSLNPATQISFEAWVYPLTDTAGPDVMQVIANKEITVGPTTTTQYEFARRLSATCGSGGGIPTGNFSFYFDLPGLPNDCSGWVDGGAYLPLNTWSHVAVTYDGSNIRSYVNGVLARTLAASGTLSATAGDFRIGARLLPFERWLGKIDEAGLYARALPSGEIAALAVAGRSCKCKPTATTAPSGLIRWWAADGNVNDISGSGGNGTLQNGAGFAVGKTGQSFRLNGINQYVDVGDVDLPSTFTLEAWIKPAAVPSASDATIIEKDAAGQRSYFLHISSGGTLRGLVNSGGGFTQYITNAAAIVPNVWQHVVFTYDGAAAPNNKMRFYVNGVNFPATVQFGQDAGGTPENNALAARIGIYSDGTNFAFNGLIDEFSVYNRVLTTAEHLSIYNADLAGKYKSAFTGLPPIAGKGSTDGMFSVTVGDATIFVPTIVSPGVTQSVPLSLAGLPPLPNQSMGLTYDISTTATYAGSPSVCFNVPSFTPAEFPTLRVLHLENGNWVNRTAASTHPNLCTTALPSLSPFAIVNNLAPVASNVSVSGRVTTAGGAGLRNAIVSMTDPDGVTRRTRTSSFGYFRFDDVAVGRTYVVTVASKRYTFSPRAVTIEDELSDLDFIGQP